MKIKVLYTQLSIRKGSTAKILSKNMQKSARHDYQTLTQYNLLKLRDN